MVLRSRLVCALGGLALLATLGGCATRTPYEELVLAKPKGSAFDKALYADYAALARSLDIASIPGRTSFDADSSFSLTRLAPEVADTAIAYSEKARAIVRGEDVLPEPAPTEDSRIEDDRLVLLRLLAQGRKAAPVEAARAQVQFDCWIMNSQVAALKSAAAACHRAFLADVAHLKSIPAVTAEPPPAPAAAPGSDGQVAPTATGEEPEQQ